MATLVRSIYDGLSPQPLQILKTPTSAYTDSAVDIHDHEYIGSYNWASGHKTSSIIVPGSPPVWTGRSPPFQLNADRGLQYVDHNGFCMGDRLLVPLFAAVKEQTPTFDWNKVDIVTDRNGLRKLLRWVRGEEKGFRIDLELVGEKTLLMRRWEAKYQEQMSGYTFGFAFEQKMTEAVEGCEGSTGHHRIITYDLSGLRMVVRFEVDACTDDTPASSVGSLGGAAGVDDIAAGLRDVGISSKTKAAATTRPAKKIHDMAVIKGGSVVPGYSVVELGTIAAHRLPNQDWADKFAQVFLSRTPNHFLGVHTRGRVSAIQKRHFSSPEFVNAKRGVQEDVKKLRKALQMIRELVKAHVGTGVSLSLVYEGYTMKVYKRNGGTPFLPESVMKEFKLKK